MQGTYQGVGWGQLGVRYPPHLLQNAAHRCSGLGARLGAGGRWSMAHIPAYAFHSPPQSLRLRGFLLTLFQCSGLRAGQGESAQVRLGPEVFPNWRRSREALASGGHWANGMQTPSGKGWASKSGVPGVGVNIGTQFSETWGPDTSHSLLIVWLWEWVAGSPTELKVSWAPAANL